MKIIAQKNAVVNIFCPPPRRAEEPRRPLDISAERAQKSEKESPVERKYSSLGGKPIEKMADNKRRAIAVARKLDELGLHDRAARMMACASVVSYQRCKECGTVHITSINLCRDRLCPVCSWRLSLRRYAEMCSIASMLSANISWDDCTAQLITLTVRNVPDGQLATTLDHIMQSLNRLNCRKSVRKMLVGSARSLEITYNDRRADWHPHLHILAICKREHARDAETWRQMWAESARLDYIDQLQVDVQDITPTAAGDEDNTDALLSAALETLKYMCKPADLDKLSTAKLGVLLDAVHGRHMIGYTGIIRDLRRALGYIHDEDITQEDGADLAAAQGAACRCGGEWAYYIGQWIWGASGYWSAPAHP